MGVGNRNDRKGEAGRWLQRAGESGWGCQGPDAEGLPALLRALDSVRWALGQAASEIE